MDKPATIPTSPPEMAPLKLVTMTVESDINNTYLNLDVISRFFVLDKMFKGLKCRSFKRGFLSNPDSNSMKNVCAFNVEFEGKTINSKLYNNGKVINVGCLSARHGIEITHGIRYKIQGLQGELCYVLDDAPYLTGKPKKFIKDMFKRSGRLICELSQYFGMKSVEELMRSVVTLDDQTITGILRGLEQDSEQSSHLKYVLLVIELLKKYVSPVVLFPSGTEMVLEHPRVKVVLDMVQTFTNDTRTKIEGVFPAYLDHQELIPYFGDYEISLINKGSNCNFFVNRDELHKHMKFHPEVENCEYDKGRYAGVNTTLRIPEHLIVYPHKRFMKIIIFNTGKINITATHTHEQVDYAFEFIRKFCRENFDDILLRMEYENRLFEYQASLPEKFEVEEDRFLLNKRFIISNPRNVRLLKKLGKLDSYRIKSEAQE